MYSLVPSYFIFNYKSLDIFKFFLNPIYVIL